MSTTLTEDEFGELQEPRTPVSEVLPWIGMLAMLAVVAGALAAVFWSRVVVLPSYTILRNGRAVVTERALTEFVAAYAWFVICGAVVGIGLGIVAWKWFKPLGWPAALLAAGAGLLSGLVCWKLGEVLGPGDFSERIAQASPGDLVPISLTLRSWSAPAVWAFAAVTPVLLAASLGPDDAGEPVRRGSARPEEEQPENVDERGVMSTVGEEDLAR
ncbi:MAG: hypothetical protein VB093_04245 [Propionicimonas sp.]|nr:hypothetical protein [Propionicimonas sp.]